MIATTNKIKFNTFCKIKSNLDAHHGTYSSEETQGTQGCAPGQFEKHKGRRVGQLFPGREPPCYQVSLASTERTARFLAARQAGITHDHDKT